MTLLEQVDSDLKEAMRAKDATKLGVLRMLKSALKYAAIAKSSTEGDLSDAEAVQVIRKQAKQRQDSIESFEKGGRVELAQKEKEELTILNSYLPRQMSAEELAKAVQEIESADGHSDEGIAGEGRRPGRRQNAQHRSGTTTIVMVKRSQVLQG
jgi:uncharacterized protein YqeY